MAVLSNSAKDNLQDGFTMPFIETAKYLGMYYLGDAHIWFTEDGKEIHPDAFIRIEKIKQTGLST